MNEDNKIEVKLKFDRLEDAQIALSYAAMYSLIWDIKEHLVTLRNADEINETVVERAIADMLEDIRDSDIHSSLK